MNRQTIIVVVVIVLGTTLFGCGPSEVAQLRAHRGTESPSREKQGVVGTPDPAAVYCGKLGYKYSIVTDEAGRQHGICIFPDSTECASWDFYRGKCGQEWSYCKQSGYELKELARYEGWSKGAVCVDGTTKEEVGSVFDLFLASVLMDALPEETKRYGGEK